MEYLIMYRVKETKRISRVPASSNKEKKEMVVSDSSEVRKE